MNIEGLKSEFKMYLYDQGRIEKKDDIDNKGDVDLFKYSSDLKKYLDENKGADDINIKAVNVDDILKFDLNKNSDISGDDEPIDIREIDAYDIELDDTHNDDLIHATSKKNDDENSSEISEKQNDTSLIPDILKELMKEEKFKKAIDLDNSGEIDDEEFKNFVNKIKGIDKEVKDISAEDLLTAAKQIENGVFDVSESEKELNEQDIEGLKLDMKNEKPSSSDRIPLRSNVGGASIPSGGLAAGVNTYDPSFSLKTTENMSGQELKNELEHLQKQLIEKQSILSSIIDNTDSKIKSLNENVQQAYKSYYNQVKSVNPDLAANLDKLNNNINEKQEELNKKDKEIEEKESAIAIAKILYDDAQSTRKNLEGILNDLQSSPSNGKDISSKIAQVSKELEAAKLGETNAANDLETKKSELTILKQERSEIEKELNDSKSQMKKLKKEISKKYTDTNPEQAAWDKMQETFQKEKAAARDSAKTEVTNTQQQIGKIAQAQSTFTNNDALSKYNNQYNQEVGQKIAAAAQNVPGTVGYCLRGVADSLDAVYGAGAFPPIMSAYQAADLFASNDGIGSHFTEVQVSREDLSKLPAGAVIVWNNNANGGGSNVSAAGKVHGHISIALGNGQESSDHIQEQITDRDATFRVFFPNS